MKFDSQYYPYSSQRRVVFGNKGMVATSQALAAQAGLDIIKKGGNAIDAAIATAACLTVVEPTSNGIGGDAFAMVWINDHLFGLNSSGPAPFGINGDLLRNQGLDQMPDTGWIPVTVPGVPAAWAELSKRFGRLPLPEVLLPAINYAQNGFPVSSVISDLWRRAFNRYIEYRNLDELRYWFETFAPKGRCPLPGEMWVLPEQAKTLQEIGDTYAETFYRGEIADKIDAFSKKYGGYLSKKDLDSFSPEWVKPISVNYRGYDVWEIPPNGQGLVALMTLNILKEISLSHRECPETFHYQIEAMKLAFSDGKEYITDHKQMNESVDKLLSSKHAEKRRNLITDEAIEPSPESPSGSETVYLATADGEGNMVSYIQSNYMGFGSGLVVPGTGISLQNRGANFSLKPTHANYIKPGKKTYHTIIPGFLTREDKAVGPFGVMGGFMQPQGHVQVVMNLLDFGLNPQSALDAPRWQWTGGKKIKIEQEFPKHIAEVLERRGHIIEGALDSGEFGRGQIILRGENNVLIGATEPRTDGAVAVW